MSTKIACLMGTYGRYALACESLASFLQQTRLEDATLTILNQHPAPLSFDHPRVTVVNEQMPGAGIRRIRQRLIELAPADADFLHWWDDDDWYLPWHLDDCLTHAPGHIAWKPRQSWVYMGPGNYNRLASNFEATVAFDATFLRGARADTHPEYPEHPAFMQLVESDRLASTELGDLSSFLYRWNSGSPHFSLEQHRTQAAYDHAMETFRTSLNDASATQMVPPSLMPVWRAFIDGVRDQVSSTSLEEIETRLPIAEAAANP